MSAVTQETAVNTGRIARTIIYLVLLLFAIEEDNGNKVIGATASRNTD